MRAAVELAKDWRTDRALRRLEALLAVANAEASLIITGNGDVIQPEQDLIAIGSGGSFALSAARALYNNTDMAARDIVEKASPLQAISASIPTIISPLKSWNINSLFGTYFYRI